MFRVAIWQFAPKQRAVSSALRADGNDHIDMCPFRAGVIRIQQGLQKADNGHGVDRGLVPQRRAFVSAISFGAAKAITVAKTSTPGAPAKRIGTPELRNLVQDDNGNPDIGDFQMIVVTVIAAAIYFWSTFDFLGSIALSHTVTLPNVDTAPLSGFGLGQGAYLAKKAALPVGQS